MIMANRHELLRLVELFSLSLIVGRSQLEFMEPEIGALFRLRLIHLHINIICHVKCLLRHFFFFQLLNCEVYSSFFVVDLSFLKQIIKATGSSFFILIFIVYFFVYLIVDDRRQLGIITLSVTINSEGSLLINFFIFLNIISPISWTHSLVELIHILNRVVRTLMLNLLRILLSYILIRVDVLILSIFWALILVYQCAV